MVEVELEKDVPQPLLVIFAITTTLVVAIHLIALFISTCLLPHIDAVAGDREGRDSPLATSALDLLRRSPHSELRRYIELAWILSTGIGILLFLAQMAVVAWVRFHSISSVAAIASTAIIVPAIIIFLVFSIHFYRRLISHKYAQVSRELEELENDVMNLEFGNHQRLEIV